MRTRFLLTLVGLLIAASSHADTTVSVTATSNLYGAGHAVPPAPEGNGAGVLPVLVTLSGATPAYVTFSNASGVVHYNSSLTDGPDGAAAGLTYMPTYGGLSGYRLAGIRVLSGVFLDDTEPTDPAPDTLFADSLTFKWLAPGLRQLFPIGDGLTGTGSGVTQSFLVPAGATRLFLGYIDSFGGILPGWYGDNSGSVSITLAEHPGASAAVEPPPPPSFALAGARPNPATSRSLRVEFTLPSTERAVLELLDVTGRRLAAREVGGGSPGRHAVDLARDVRLRPGLYLVRLTQGDRSLTARAAVVD